MFGYNEYNEAINSQIIIEPTKPTEYNFTLSNKYLIVGTDNITLNSTVEMKKVSWYINGKQVTTDSKNNSSVFFLDNKHFEKKGFEKNKKDIVRYKAGVNPTTGKLRYQVTVMYDNGTQSWIVER